MDVAIVGMGPRGLSVLERLIARLTESPVDGAVRIWTFEPGSRARAGSGAPASRTGSP